MDEIEQWLAHTQKIVITAYKVAADVAYQNAMKNNDKKTTRIEHAAALQRVMIDLLADHTELFKQFSDNTSFKTRNGWAIPSLP